LTGRVLLVDDSELNRNLIGRRIQEHGHELTVSADGSEALQALAEDRFDVVLLDLVMPGMDGYEVLTRIRSDARFRDVPVIMLTAMEDNETLVRCLQLGADDYLPKSFPKELLRARLANAIERKRLRDRVADLEGRNRG
jgi:CheY-like chemotaxis protein